MIDTIDISEEKSPQNIVLENRKKLEMTGIDEVDSYDENQIIAITSSSLILIKGSNLQIQKFNNKTKELNITGKIDEIKYSNGKKRDKKSFIKKLFK